MKSNDEVKELFYKYDDVMRTSELRAANLYYADIQRLISSNVIEQIRRGYYHLVDPENMSEVNIINRLFPEAILCMDTALFYYGYTDRTPSQWHLAVSKDIRKSRFNLDYPFVKPHYIEPSILEIGLSDGTIDGNKVRIYDKERTLCDCLKHVRKMDREVFNKAIQNYIKDPKKSIPHLMDYAKQLRVEKKVRDMIGVWL